MFGFFAAIFIARRDGEAMGFDGVSVADLGILMLILGILGARLLAVLTDGLLMDFVHLCTDSTLVEAVDTQVRICQENSDCGFEYLCNLDVREQVLAGTKASMCYPPTDCLAAFKFWQGGLTFYGGLLLAVPGGLWFAKRRKMGGLKTADLLAPSLMLGLALGRVGCFLNGCCYGAQTEGPLGVQFPGHAFGRHPTQLYESVFAFSLFIVLRHVLRQRTRGEGELFGYLLCFYGIFRVAIEWLRDDKRGGLAMLSTSQLISIPLIAIGGWLIFRARRGASPSKDEIGTIKY